MKTGGSSPARPLLTHLSRACTQLARLTHSLKGRMVGGGTQKDFWMCRSASCPLRHCRPLALTARMNTRLPTAVAATRLCGFSSLHRSAAQRSQ